MKCVVYQQSEGRFETGETERRQKIDTNQKAYSGLAESVCAHCAMRGRLAACAEVGLRLSARMKHPSKKLAPQNRAAVEPGPCTPNLSAVKDPSAGPKMKPSPKAMPIKPMLLERFSGGLISAMYAEATDKVAPQIPAKTREMSKITRPVEPLIPDATAKRA